MTVSEKLEPDPADAGPADAAQPTAEPLVAEPSDDDPSVRAIPPLREVAEIKKPSTIGGIVFLGVLATAVVGIAVAATGAWRTGATWLAASLVAAATARVVLREDDAGMLRVRRKLLDAVILTGTGAAIVFLAWSIPDRSR